MLPADPTRTDWTPFAALTATCAAEFSAPSCAVGIEGGAPTVAALTPRIQSWLEPLRRAWSKYTALSDKPTVAEIPADPAPEWIVTVAAAFSVPVAVLAPWLVRWFQSLRQTVAAICRHAARRWALPRFEPLVLARAIHAPPAMMAAMLTMGGTG
jgi:hypothetical protein